MMMTLTIFDHLDNDYDDHQSILAGQLDEQVQLLVIKLNLKLLGNLLQKIYQCTVITNVVIFIKSN